MQRRRLPRAALYYTPRGKKETVKGPESVGLTGKPGQVYGLILEEEEDDDDEPLMI